MDMEKSTFNMSPEDIEMQRKTEIANQKSAIERMKNLGKKNEGGQQDKLVITPAMRRDAGNHAKRNEHRTQDDD